MSSVLVSGEVYLVALGPLTNVAIALRLDENLGKKLKEIVVMGGNIQGKSESNSFLIGEVFGHTYMVVQALFARETGGEVLGKKKNCEFTCLPGKTKSRQTFAVRALSDATGRLSLRVFGLRCRRTPSS